LGGFCTANGCFFSLANAPGKKQKTGTHWVNCINYNGCGSHCLHVRQNGRAIIFKMKLEHNWQNKSIAALEKQDYGDPLSAPTSLVKKCLEYVKIPIGDLTTEQLRLLIAQEIGLAYLIPLALDVLSEDILTESDFYPGDLLKNVATVDDSFWKSNTELYHRLNTLIEKGKQQIEQAGLDLPDLLPLG
jgi:hypothetical protein